MSRRSIGTRRPVPPVSTAVLSAELGSLCAGEIIKHLGARPEVDLEELAIEAGLL